MPELEALAFTGRNPDVLTCIANLSNDEVFTPPALANQMLDTVAEAWAADNDGANIWADSTVRFLDPSTKSGVFLREITKRLIDGLSDEIPDLQQRVDHILTKQVYGIAITELTSLLARRSVYCSKWADGEHSVVTSFADSFGNIWYEPTEHAWTSGKCLYCGAAQAALGRDDGLETHAYAFIHTDEIKARMADIYGENMKFDVIIGNPPYQIDDGGFGASASPIYQRFVEQAIALEPSLLSMIIPARWLTGGKGLADFRGSMFKERRISSIDLFEDSRDCFDGVDVAGGVMYFLWDRAFEGDCTVTNHDHRGATTVSARPLLEPGMDVFIRSNQAMEIVRKVSSRVGSGPDGHGNATSLASIVSARNPFGFASNFRGKESPKAETDLQIVQNGGIGWVSRPEVVKNEYLIDKWKVLVSYSSSEHAGQPDRNGRKKVLARVETMPPGVIGTESYLVVGEYDGEHFAENLVAYMSTKFVRFLVAQLVHTQHVTRSSFGLVPLLDMGQTWTDRELYSEFGLSASEIDLIEARIKPMGPNGE